LLTNKSARNESSTVLSTDEFFVGRSHKKRLNQWLATGICGNDITSSCLYVSAIAAVFAGVLAPVVLLLKVRRKELKRTFRAGWSTILVAITATSLGMIGNVIIDYKNLLYFLQYFIPTILLVVIMYLRIPILKTILQMLNNLMSRILVWRTKVIDNITGITDQRVILFTRGVALGRLHAALSIL